MSYDISIRVAEVCREKKLRQVDLKNNGLGSQQTINNIFHERNDPSLPFISKFLNLVTDIDARWLITGKGSMYKQVEDDILKEPPENYGLCIKCIKKDSEIEVLQRGNLKLIEDTKQQAEEIGRLKEQLKNKE